MSRSVIAMIVITLVCFVVAIAFLEVVNVYSETDGLSVVSHGIHVLPQNPIGLKEKLEELAEENFQYWMATDDYDGLGSKLFGTSITMKYQTPIDMRWVVYQDVTDPDPDVILVKMSKIIATIPDNSDKYRIVVYSSASDPDRYDPTVHVMLMLPEQANELLNLIGLDPIEKKS